MLRFNEDVIALSVCSPNAETVIEMLANLLQSQGWVRESYGFDTIQREMKHPTGLPTHPFCIAIPHADADGVIESSLAMAMMREPVKFKNMGDPDEELYVWIIFMLANNNPQEQVALLRQFAELFGEPDKLQELRSISTKAEIYQWMKTELKIE
jgi:PTS system galactitol-specific IIA component